MIITNICSKEWTLKDRTRETETLTGRGRNRWSDKRHKQIDREIRDRNYITSVILHGHETEKHTDLNCQVDMFMPCQTHMCFLMQSQTSP